MILLAAILAQAYCQGAVGNPGWHQVVPSDIPTASSSSAGALSSTDWSTFNNKASTGSCSAGQFETGDNASGGPSCATPAGGAPSGNAGGDLGGTYPNPTVTGLSHAGNYVANVANGAGISGGSSGSNGAALTLATDSTAQNFVAAGALTCGAGTNGKMKVHTTPLQYCDNAATPALQYAAYGDASGNATSASFNYVTSVATAAPLTGGVSASSGAILSLACTTATDSVAGCLSAADHTTLSGRAGTVSCTNQFVRSTSTSGGSCAAVANTDLVHSSVTVTAGTGLGGGGAVALGSSVSLNTDSSQAGFLATGALTCGSGTAGKVQVHTTPLEYCDNAATPTLRYSAYGDSSGVATSASTSEALSANYVASVATSAPLSGGAAGGNATAISLSLGTVGVGNGGTGQTAFGSAAGAIITSGASGTGALSSVPAVAAGSFLVSNGTAANSKYLAIQSCTSSSATTCTITVARSGCVPICGPGATATGTNALKSATVSSTTLTCTFLVSGTNTCNCICP